MNIIYICGLPIETQVSSCDCLRIVIVFHLKYSPNNKITIKIIMIRSIIDLDYNGCRQWEPGLPLTCLNIG